MPTPPPVDSTQRYPIALRDFMTYQNQPGDSNHIVNTPNPGPGGGMITTDLTIDAAAVTRDIETEVVSLEKTIGAKPFLVPQQTTLGKSVVWLYNNKSPGKVDARNSVNPLPMPSHNHPHPLSTDLSSDDHDQYVRVDGARGFNNPVTAPPATSSGHLITLAQARGAGLTAPQVESVIQAQLAADAAYTVTAFGGGRFRMAGGWYYGYTNVNGDIYVDFGPAGFSQLMTFVYMKMPYPGESMLGWYQYQYVEDQLILLSMNQAGAWIQFIEDIRVDRQALVSMTWMAVGR